MSNPFIEFQATYGPDPVAFVRDFLSLEPDPWQADVLREVAKGTRQISIRSAHGVGKSACLSWAAIWFLLTRYRCKVVMTAPSAPQLFDVLFAETRGWVSNLPPYLKGLLTVTSDKIALTGAPDECFISARTSRAETPEAMAGVHSDHVLLLADEASGIPEEVFNSASGSMSGERCTTILTGNPTRANGYFYDTHCRPELLIRWKRYHISGFDSKRVEQAFIDEVKAKAGEGSNEWRIRVLGEFPTTDDDTIIPMELIDSAMNRDVSSSPTAEEVWGLDVARFGDDRSALVRRRSNVVTQSQTWKNLDLMQLCSVVKAEWDVSTARPSSIMVDSIGIGAGVVDRLRELGLPILGVNVSEVPSIGNYRNLRAELWYRCRDWFVRRDCKIPKDKSFAIELAAVRYSFATASNKIQVESKADMKNRGLKSPDLADALMLTFAAPEGIYTNGTGYRWREPLRRDLRGIV